MLRTYKLTWLLASWQTLHLQLAEIFNFLEVLFAGSEERVFFPQER